jgi:hypothetical protein
MSGIGIFNPVFIQLWQPHQVILIEGSGNPQAPGH